LFSFFIPHALVCVSSDLQFFFSSGCIQFYWQYLGRLVGDSQKVNGALGFTLDVVLYDEHLHPNLTDWSLRIVVFTPLLKAVLLILT
jgi:hypothetical protein